MDENRLKHSIFVGRKMVEIGREKGLPDNELNDLFVLGYIHDIGYEFSKNSQEHNVIGGNVLKENGYKYWQEVYYHGEPNLEYQSLYLDILNDADLQIDKFGNDVGYKKRLEDIETRYGSDSIQILKARQLLKIIKEEF